MLRSRRQVLQLLSGNRSAAGCVSTDRMGTRLARAALKHTSDYLCVGFAAQWWLVATTVVSAAAGSHGLSLAILTTSDHVEPGQLMSRCVSSWSRFVSSARTVKPGIPADAPLEGIAIVSATERENSHRLEHNRSSICVRASRQYMEHKPRNKNRAHTECS